MYSLNTARTLIDAGIDVELLCYPNSRLHIEAVKHRIKVHAFNFGRYFTPASLYRLNKLIRGNKFDLIHAESSKELLSIYDSLVKEKSSKQEHASNLHLKAEQI